MSVPVIETASPPRVLVVEDEPKMRKSVAEGLRLEPWTVQTAATGEEAIARLVAGRANQENAFSSSKVDVLECLLRYQSKIVTREVPERAD